MVVLIIIAAICNAIMDKTKDHFGKSIFRDLKPLHFWKANEFAGKKKVIGIWVDAWHVAKLLMLICICFVIVLYEPITPYLIADVAILYFSFSLTFLLFYNFLLQKKQ